MGQERNGLRARKKKRVQNELWETAIDLFEKNGYDAVSVKEIAAAADVSLRTFYRYFPTKADILFHLPDVLEALSRAQAEEHPGETDNEFIVRLLHAALTAHDPKRAARGYRLIPTSPALMASTIKYQWEVVEPIVQAMIKRGPNTGDAEFRAHVLVKSLTAAISSGFALWILSGQRGPIWKTCEKALEVLYDSFEPRPGAPSP